MTPVYTAAGQGTLWVGSMFLARNPRAMKANRIRVRMSCLAAPLLRLCQNHGCRDARKKQTTHIFVAIRAQAFRPWYM